MPLSKLTSTSRLRQFALAFLCYSAMKRLGISSLRRVVGTAFLVWLHSISANKPASNAAPEGAPKWFPVIGHMLISAKLQDDSQNFWLGLMQDCDFKSVELCLPDGLNIMTLMDERDRRYMLKDNFKNFQKNFNENLGVMANFHELFGDGIFSTDGDTWTVHRKVASHLFTGRTIGVTMAKVFAEHAELLKDSLLEKADSGEVFDIQLLLQSLIFDAFCKIAFGVSPRSFELAEKGEKSAFQVAFDDVQLRLGQRLSKPPALREWDRFFTRGTEKSVPGSLKILDDYLYSIVRERKAAFETNGSSGDQPNDILGLYMAFAVKQGRPDLLKEKYIRDVIVNFMVAGRDTTSYVLTNALSMVAEDGAVEAELVKQSRAKLAGGVEDFALNQAKDFPLTDAIFNESLRMFPSVGYDLRFAIESDILPSGLQVRAGSMVGIANFALGRSPYNFTDPNEFKPSRWLREEDGNTVCDRIDEYKYPWFWGGSRICLGKDMARLEAKIFLGVLFNSLKLSLAKPKKMAFSSGPVMFYKDGVHLRAERR